MDGLQARLDSFKKSKRVKNPNKSSTTTLKWPHPIDFIASPSTLADAGFYYDPSYDDPDNVTCFNCEKQLAGWEEDDDPYLIHWKKCAQTCCWAVVQCGLKADMDRSGRFVFPDKTRLPNHKTMEKARLESFNLGKGWTHDKTRNHSANSKSMARAGFAYTPHETGDDLATCLYCSVSLSGWEEDDNPMEEHRKRAAKSDTNCPFFEYTESRQTKPSSSKPPSRSTSRTKYQDISVPMKTFDGEVEDESDIPQPTTRGLGAKTPAKSRSRSRKSSAKTPRPKSRSASRSGLNDVADVVEDDSEAPEPPPTVKKTKRSASKPVKKSEALTQSNVEDEAEQPAETKTKARARSKSVARSEALQSDGEVEVATTARKPTRSRAKSRAPIAVEEEEEVEPIRKSSRSKSKVPAVAKDDDAGPPQKASRKSSKPKVVQESDQGESVDHSAFSTKRPRTTAHKRTGSRSRPKPPEVEDVVFVDEYLPPPSSPPPTRQPTTNEHSSLSVPKYEANAPPNGPLKGSEVSSSAPSDKEAETGKRKPGRPPKARVISEDKPKQPNRVVEVSSDEEEVQKRDCPKPNETKERTIEPIETSGPPNLNGFKQSGQHSLEKPQPIQELHTASMPLVPISSEETDHPDAPHSIILQTSVDKSAESQPGATSDTIPVLDTKPHYLPPLSRLPFMPLESLNEAELDMTVEEWIRYQIEVEQDRFKRDGERELERFKKRAEEVRKAIESL